MNRFASSSAPRRSFLSASVLMALAASSGVSAQDEVGAETTSLDRIEVTGSRIRKVDTETSQPVLSISREQIEQQGFSSVADILQNISAAGSPALSRAQPLSSGEAVGGSYISLRNLDARRTLVLVNGKRLGITTGGFQDLSTIPAAIIERVEVLKDGASSVYGSDAIGGVVNFITRRGFEGLTVDAYVGGYSQGDGDTENYNLVTGFVGDRGSLTAALEYASEDKVRAVDRDFSAFPRSSRYPTLGWTTVSQWGGLVRPSSQGGNLVLNRGAANSYSLNNFHALNSAAPNGDVSNTNEQTDLRTPQNRRSAFIDGVYDISDTVRLRTNLMHSNRETTRQVAGYPYQSAAFNTPMSVDSYFNPMGSHHGFATPQSVSWFRRTWEQPRISESDLTTLRFTAGLEGSFDLGDRYFDWDASYLHNNNKLLSSDLGNLNLANVARAVGPSFLNAQGQVQCGTAANPIALGLCLPWNPFIGAGQAGAGSLTGNKALQNYLFQEEHTTGETTTEVLAANLTGAIFTLPAGDMAFAAGVESRKESGEFIPDALSQTGGSTNLGRGPTMGEYSVDEVYAEFLVPLLSGVTGAQELSVSLASRYSDFDTFGDTTNSKVGLTWRPMDELLVRGTWAEGFRAPAIANLYGGGSQTFSFFTDPCDTRFGASATNTAVRARCAADIPNANTFRQLAQGFVPSTVANAQTPVPFSSTSDPNLMPETSVSRTAGVVWSPNFVDGLSMSLDWWKVRVENTIVDDTPSQMLSDCYVAGITSRCTGFTRDPVTGMITALTFANRNAGYIEVEGFDFDLSYRLDTDFGQFAFSSQNTYTSKNEFKTTNNPGVLPSQGNGFSQGTVGAISTNFRLRSNTNVGWTYGSFGINWGARYFSGIKEACLSATLFPWDCSNPNYIAANPAQSGPVNRIGSNTFHDVQFRWNAPWSATVSVGANNVFNHLAEPMYTGPSATSSYYGGFDIGRFWYMRYQQRF